MGIAFDGSVNLVATALALFSGTNPGGLAVWGRNPAVSAATWFAKLRNAGTTAELSLLGQSNTVLGGNYMATAGDSAFKASGDDETAAWKPMMVYVYSSTGGATIDRIRFWSGAATTGVEDALGPAKANNLSLLTVMEIGLGDSSEVAEPIVFGGAGFDLTAAQAFWTAFKAGTLPETIDPSHTVTNATLLNTGALALSGGGTLAFVGSGTPTNSSTHPISRTAPDTTAPTLSGTITLSGVTTTGFTATCPVATDNVAVTGYQYNLDAAGWVDIAAGGRSITFTGKTPGNTYSVQMRAKDAVPNFSAPLTASQTLPTGGDTTVPTLTGAITLSALTPTSYTLTHAAGADNVAVTSYELSLDGGTTWADVGNVLTNNVTGRTPGATDQVRYRSKDAAGNVSTPALSLAVTLDVYKCSILDWVLPTNTQHNIGEQWNISFHNVGTRALVAYAPGAALVAGVNGAGQASRNLVVGNAAFVQGTTYAWFATHPTNATWFAVGQATAA